MTRDRTGAGGTPPTSQRREVSELNQFAAVLRKNFLLRTSASAGSGSGGLISRSARGWLGLCLEVGLPVLFFLIAALPRFYVAPTPLPQQFFPRGSLQSLDWVMEYYKGPAAASASGALLLFAPNSTKVQPASRCPGAIPCHRDALVFHYLRWAEAAGNARVLVGDGDHGDDGQSAQLRQSANRRCNPGQCIG